MQQEDDPVIAAIREATIKEELAIPVYDSHISAALFWSGLPEKTQERILAGLKTLTSDSKKHVLLLKRVEALVRGERATVSGKGGAATPVRSVPAKRTTIKKAVPKKPVKKKTPAPRKPAEKKRTKRIA